MLCPNKAISFSESAISKIPVVIDILKQTGTKNISDLFKQVNSLFQSVHEFVLAVDTLYLLDVISLNEQTGDVTYVERNTI